MKTRMSAAAALLAMAITALPHASAHRINPLANKYRQHAEPTLWARISEPVHEEITLRARACAALATVPAGQPLVCDAQAPYAGDPDGNKYDSLVRGVWWNDDPNQLLFAGRQPKWFGWMKDGERIARHARNWLGRPARITPRYYMNYRSHFGDLQFLHAMASADGEAAADTRAHVLEWAEFAWAVATRKIAVDRTLDQVTTPGFQARFSQQSGWTVGYLFGPRYLLRQNPDHYPDLALGSLLHVVQDSYSEAHVQRDFAASPRCPDGRIVRFHSYVHQDGARHGTADTRGAWQARRFTAAQDPVNVSASLIRYADSDAPWPEVARYLALTVFCIDDDAQPASAGAYG